MPAELRKNKKWVRPVLTVLLRGGTAEAVLVACKGDGFGGAAGTLQGECITCVDYPNCFTCGGPCSSVGAS